MVLSNDNVAEGAMPNEKRMTIDERFKYLRIMQKQYRKGKRKERSQLLDQMEVYISARVMIIFMQSPRKGY